MANILHMPWEHSFHGMCNILAMMKSKYVMEDKWDFIDTLPNIKLTWPWHEKNISLLVEAMYVCLKDTQEWDKENNNYMS